MAPRHEGGLAIRHDPVVWVADAGFVVKKGKAIGLAVFEAGCTFPAWALEALEKAVIQYRVVYASRSTSGLLGPVSAGFAVAPVVQGSVPSDLKTGGAEDGPPVLPVAHTAPHTAASPVPEIPACITDYLIKAFRERG